MNELPQCAGPKCSNKADPRWGPFCDGCGCTTEEERKAMIERYIKLNHDYFALRDTLKEVLQMIKEGGEKVGNKWIEAKEKNGLDSLEEIAGRGRLHDYTNATLPMMWKVHGVLQRTK